MPNVSVTLCDPHQWQKEMQTVFIHMATKEFETKATKECKKPDNRGMQPNIVNQRSANHDSGKQIKTNHIYNKGTDKKI